MPDIVDTEDTFDQLASSLKEMGLGGVLKRLDRPTIAATWNRVGLLTKLHELQGSERPWDEGAAEVLQVWRAVDLAGMPAAQRELFVDNAAPLVLKFIWYRSVATDGEEPSPAAAYDLLMVGG